jgi:hypothetical protein
VLERIFDVFLFFCSLQRCVNTALCSSVLFFGNSLCVLISIADRQGSYPPLGEYQNDVQNWHFQNPGVCAADCGFYDGGFVLF